MSSIYMRRKLKNLYNIYPNRSASSINRHPWNFKSNNNSNNISKYNKMGINNYSMSNNSNWRNKQSKKDRNK